MAAVSDDQFSSEINKLYAFIRTCFASKKIAITPIEGPSLVLGSAPNPVMPPDFDERWTLITVNASQSSFDLKPNYTVISGRLFGNCPPNIEGKEAIKNKNTGRLIIIERGFNSDEVKKILRKLNYSYEELYVINHWQRSYITHEILDDYLACGTGDKKISNGIFAALLAYYLGARPVVLTGFSFSAAGHAYNTFQRKRCHIEIDRIALLRARERNLPFYTADEKFSFESGLPYWKG